MLEPEPIKDHYMTHASRLALGVTLAVVLAGIPLMAGVKVKVLNDKTFNFEGLKTYAWRLDGVEPVKMLQSSDTTGDNPAQIRKNLEPIILAAVDRELGKKGFTRVEAGKAQPDLYLDYYVLIGPGVSSQYHGQFVGAVPAWGLPDFVMSTSALTVYEQGSLIVDIVSVAQKQAVWRGAAEAKIDRRRTPEERQGIIDDAVTQMLQKFPPKFKK
jgi:hypothetical protein